VTCNARHRTVPAPVHHVADGLAAVTQFAESMATRRSLRDFSSRPVHRRIVEQAIAVANTAPSGANRQPWRFVVVSDAATKQRIREGAEQEERAFYGSRASEEWLDALEPLGTDWRKPHLTAAPYLIVVFEVHEPKPYYVKESVGIAVGFLLAALHAAGVAALTHTPSPMRFLNQLLDRPASERPSMVLPVGYPADDAQVPDLMKKSVEEVLVWRR
jgi:iodotyrosine deiodinase